MRIYLIGYMGCGKSTVGKKLAAKMQLPFIDLDALLEADEGKKIAELFAQNGEPYFREKESVKLREKKTTTGIFATGGGLPMHHQNMDFMLQNGVVVYLAVTPEFTCERVLPKLAKRPVLPQGNPEEVLAFITRHMVQCTPSYKRAHLTVNAEELDIVSLAKTIERCAG